MGSGLRQALLQREEHQLAAMVEVELVADVANVVAHGLRANGAVMSDLLCASTARDPGEDIPFALASDGSRCPSTGARLTRRLPADVRQRSPPSRLECGGWPRLAGDGSQLSACGL